MRMLTLISLFFITSVTTALGNSPAAEQAAAQEFIGGTISGQVLLKDKTPIVNGVVLLYDKNAGPPPSLGKYWRIPDLITPLGKDGAVHLEVPPGTYYLQVAQKNPDSEIGPAKEREYLYFHGDAAGNAKPIIITPGATLDLGKLTAILWSPDMVERTKGITAVEGMIISQDGKPVENAVVFAYFSPEASGRPAFISDRTDKKGKYLIRFADGGTYYLKVRGVIGGGTPESGEFLNATSEFKPEQVTLKKDQKLQGVNLKVKQLSRPGSSGTTEKRDWKKIAPTPTQ